MSVPEAVALGVCPHWNERMPDLVGDNFQGIKR
jgi:hypothetical protein